MKIILTAIVILLASVFALGQDQPIENGWKNMKLFEMKRAEVDKLLGKSSSFGDVMIYRFQRDSVWVFYSKGPCMGASDEKYNVEKDAVVGYRVFFFRDFPLTDLKWKREDYSREPLGRAAMYANKDKSIRVVAFPIGDDKESVTTIDYSPSAEQKKKFSCEQ